MRRPGSPDNAAAGTRGFSINNLAAAILILNRQVLFQPLHHFVQVQGLAHMVVHAMSIDLVRFIVKTKFSVDGNSL
jgi:hypothetical protein